MKKTPITKKCLLVFNDIPLARNCLHTLSMALAMGHRDKSALRKAFASPANQKNLGDYPKLGPEDEKMIPNAIC